MKGPFWALCLVLLAGCSLPEAHAWHYADAERKPRREPAKSKQPEAFPKVNISELIKPPAAGTVAPGTEPRVEPSVNPQLPASPGQAPAKLRNDEPTLGADGWYHLKDKTGLDWKWTEPGWLKEWVRRVNAGQASVPKSPVSFDPPTCVGLT